MKNVQITVDDKTLREVDRVAKPLGLKRSEVVRQALTQWLRQRAVDNFEREWITALGKNADDASRADEWLAAQSWDKR